MCSCALHGTRNSFRPLKTYVLGDIFSPSSLEFFWTTNLFVITWLLRPRQLHARCGVTLHDFGFELRASG